MKTMFRMAALAVALTACDSIIGVRPVCACSPPGGGTAIIAGQVVTAADAPAAGAVVTWEVLNNAPCQNTASPSAMKAVVTASADGRFRHPTAWSGGNKCFRVFARAQGAAPGSASSDTHVVNIDFGLQGAVPDSVELLIRLP